ncbi:uncharacterized protein ColSpa_08772 [Colletotrichum spaethianum]|uniref:Uncharacterized protein n=1 Tax=Colletotrichum spaethianum TaxID=700344 RepID=A0AA37PAC0_9PEZI|nr:uncharacterized protein ColSpa_08772 [Colletotrichum spaethianum]GKT48591.1 hypothetical protein ColSpa_08772 [Colletotrichum spaethianum]
MSSPAPVPSKAAIHALRGLLFGTSCSLVLLAEERRQRIKLARSAVENGRRLKSLKRYSSSGVAALEALQEEVANDPNFIGWSARPRNHFSSYEHGKLSFDSSYLDHHVNDVGPDARRPTRAANERIALRTSSEQPAAPDQRGRSAFDAAKRCSNDPSWSRFPSSASATQAVPNNQGIQRSIESRTNTRLMEKTVIAAVVERVVREHPHDRGLARLQDSLLNPTQQQQRDLHAPITSLNLVRRAYKSVDKSQELPGWVSDLSSLLSAACQQEGNFEFAGQIMELAVNHGVIKEGSILAQRLLEVVESLVAQENLQGLAGKQLSDRLYLAARLYMGNVELLPPEQSTLRFDYVRVGKELIGRALEAKCSVDVIQLIRQVSARNQDKLGTTVWFMLQLAGHGQHILAIDAFLEIFAKLDHTSAYSKRICADIVESIIASRGYQCREVLQRINQLRDRDGWDMPRLWLRDLLWVYWNSTCNFADTLQIFNDARETDFYGIQNTYDVQSRMVRICIEANQTERARLQLDTLIAKYPRARQDVEILGEFVLQKADNGDWAGVRADFETMKPMQSVSKHNREHFKRVFVATLETYAKTHTWGEVETFLETYIPELGLSLDRHLVTFIADRHAKCRDVQALKRWLTFCKDAGYTTDGSFWTSMLTSCKRDWKYDSQQILDLYRAMKGASFDAAFPDIEQCVKNLTLTNTVERSKRVRVTAYMVSPANEASAFERMKVEAQLGNWRRVLAVYKRAVHNGMGHTSRCLKLAVRATVHFEGSRSRQAMSLLSKAQAEGCDVSEAMCPIVFTQLEEIEKAHKVTAAGREDGRGRPFPYIKAIFDDLRGRQLQIDDGLFNRAARVCQALRNYREMVTFCIIAAEVNGHNDLCYSVYNFANLLTAYVLRHEYDKVRWLLTELKDREYRTSRECRRALHWALNYLKQSSRATKSEELRKSDLEIMALVHEARTAVGDENRDQKTEAREVLLNAISRGGVKPNRAGKAASLAPAPKVEEQAWDATSEGEEDDVPPSPPVKIVRRSGVHVGKNTKETDTALRGSQPAKGAWSWSSTTVR